jgi:nicotinamide-nucleotide amidase
LRLQKSYLKPVKAQIITIGDELLIGQTIDTNSAWIGSKLSNAGFDVTRILSIHDRREDILNTLSECISKSDVIIITGGLGPTSDDITKQTLCEYFKTHLVSDPEVLEMISEMMSKRNYPFNDKNRKQAEVPASCRVLKNSTGTAPGMWFEKEGTIFVSMPGVPHEMIHIMTVHVLPELNKRFTSQIIIHRNIMTYGSFEARLAETLNDFESVLPANIKLAYLPSAGVIKLRLTGTGDNYNTLEKHIDIQVKKLYQIIPELIFAEDEETLEMTVGRLLLSRNKTMCTAESCTGGEIAHLITSIPGSSEFYKGSIIAYSNEVKTKVLGISQDLIIDKGAVSESVVKAMAENARKLLNTDFSVAVSGIAGPAGATETKPIGTVCIAVSSNEGTIAEQRVFGNDRITNIKRFSYAALNLLRTQIINH